MPRICPECKDPYDEKVMASSIREPADGRVCHHDVEFEGDSNTGVWYVHE